MKKESKNIEALRAALRDQNSKEPQETCRAIVAKLAEDIYRATQNGKSLRVIYDQIRPGLRSENQLSFNTFSKYWREVRDELGLPKIRNTGPKKRPPAPRQNGQARLRATDPTEIESKPSRWPAQKTASDFRDDPDDI